MIAALNISKAKAQQVPAASRLLYPAASAAASSSKQQQAAASSSKQQQAAASSRKQQQRRCDEPPALTPAARIQIQVRRKFTRSMSGSVDNTGTRFISYQ
jgi:hypothetical protein